MYGTVTVTPGAINASSTVNVTASVNGLLTTDKIAVEPQADLEGGLVCIAAYCAAPSVLTVRITNNSDSGQITGGAKTWAYWAWA
jgi:hypothetical protein